MSNARIEIRCKNVANTKILGIINDRLGSKTKGAPQHLFIIHTDSNGKETIIRGGPANNNEGLDDIKIVKTPYGKIDGKDSIDFVEDSPRVTIAEGTDEEMQAKFDKMWMRAQEVNSRSYDYKIGFRQNSNACVKDLVRYAELPLRLPKKSMVVKSCFLELMLNSIIRTLIY